MENTQTYSKRFSLDSCHLCDVLDRFADKLSLLVRDRPQDHALRRELLSLLRFDHGQVVLETPHLGVRPVKPAPEGIKLVPGILELLLAFFFWV